MAEDEEYNFEDEGGGEEYEEIELESILTEYDPDDFHSGAVNSLDSTIPLDLFEFEHSYGYNCQKYFNLCACDESVVCWAAGSIISFMDVNTKQTWFRRTSTGGSVGAITSHRTDPNYRLAIAENREGKREPLIILYFWPQMEIDAVLQDGTSNAYSVLDFSPDGDLLASVGKEPDYNLTIWNWKRHKILLRTSAFTFDVNTVMFSPYCPGQLTTAGAAHIKLWKMAETFTGLKLKGELGRFGKTEICDVLGAYPMPDEKVLSGCEWGNVLVWEAGLVKLEVTRRGRKTCHSAPVVQFMLSEAGDEVTTVARDGCVRAWYWDTVDQADPPEDDPYVELNPVAETCVPGCQIMCLKHQKDYFWYAQDGNGGIWVAELELDKIECDHRKVMNCHAGGVVAMAALRTYPILITAGEDGAIMAYDTVTHTLMARYTFPTAVTCMLYPPADVDETSCILMVGFKDGIMRTLLLHPERLSAEREMVDIRVNSVLTIHSEESLHADVIDLIMLVKPHSKSITQITINEQRTLLVTCGADSTIFIYKLTLGTPLTLETIGFIETPNNIAFMTWKPGEERVMFLCGQVGFTMEAVLPNVSVRVYKEITTFKLEFESYKETLVKKNFMRYRPFPTEDDLASIDEDALKAQDDASSDDDEEGEGWLGEIQLMESESMLGTTITWAEYCDEGIWVVQKGTGALLLIKPGNNKILKYAPFPGSWCDDITSLRFICDHRYLMVGTNRGYIRVVRMPTDEEDSFEHHFVTWTIAMQKLLKKLKGRKLAKEEVQPIPRVDFIDTYYLPMHDCYTGAITDIAFDLQATRLYTCGADGNIFSYIINFEEPFFPARKVPVFTELPKMKSVREPSTLDGELMSHEQLKQKEEYDKMMAIANAHKKRVRDQLSEITSEYSKIIKANRMLPCSQQIDVTIDPRPLKVQENELNEAKALTHRKLAHQLEASDLALKKMYNRNIIQCDMFPFTLKAIMDPAVMIRPLRQKNLPPMFWSQLDEVYVKMAEAALRGRRTESTTRKVGMRKPSWGPPKVHSFLLGLPLRRPHPLKKALRNYRQRLQRHHLQFIEWQEHLSRKPDPQAMPPGAAEALKEAEATIGNRLLKTQPDYVASPGHNTQLRVCMTRKEIFDIKHVFNEKVLELRQHKVKLVEQMKAIGERLAEIRVEIPPKKVKAPPPIPVIDEDLEFPEHNLEIKPEPIKLLPGGRGTGKKSIAVVDRRTLLFPQPRVKQLKHARFVPLSESRPLACTWEYLKARPEIENTPMEIEIRERRIERHLYEQDMLLADAKVSIQQFDSRLRQLQRERIRVQEKNQLLELHLYQLHREMNVLNRFEAHEDRLAERVYAKLMQVRAVQDQILDCQHRIEEHHTTKETLNEYCEELQRHFKKLVQDNKFADFLRRIFKKKYRPPRVRDDDESSESSESSSSSEEEDEGSIDSRDIGPIRLDPNICPEGCDKEVYEKTYQMRNERHKHEQDMIEQDRLVEMLRKDIDVHNKVKRKLSMQLDKRKNELREFMLEKQSCMNEVDQVIILRYSQLRASAISGCTGPDGLSKTVVFPEKLLIRLRNRVVELQAEISQQKTRQKINRTHLFRMNIDIRAMEAEAEDLRAQMREVLTRKLGKPRKVDKTLDDLLRQMARRHKFYASYGMHPQIQTQIKAWRERHGAQEQKYLKLLEHYSERLRLAAALQADVFPHKSYRDPSIMAGDYEPEDFHRDVIRLRIVRAQQMEQIQALTEEIKALRLKPLSEIPPHGNAAEPEIYEEPIRLKMPPRNVRRYKRYFPITPLGSEVNVQRMNVMMLLNDCLDAMRVSRDQAEALLRDLTNELPFVIAGRITRFEVVDKILKKWLRKHGGDPSQYKKHTKAFDALARLADRLIRQHLETMEGSTDDSNKMMLALEEALKAVSGSMKEPLKNRIGPALAALLANTSYEEMLRIGAELGMVRSTLAHSSNHDIPDDYECIEQCIVNDDTMTVLVKSLVNIENPLTAESIDRIEVAHVIDDMRDCGVPGNKETFERLINKTIQYLRAQLVTSEEAANVDAEVERAMTPVARTSTATTDRATGHIRRSTHFKDVPSQVTAASRGTSETQSEKANDEENENDVENENDDENANDEENKNDTEIENDEEN